VHDLILLLAIIMGWLFLHFMDELGFGTVCSMVYATLHSFLERGKFSPYIRENG